MGTTSLCMSSIISEIARDIATGLRDLLGVAMYVRSSLFQCLAICTYCNSYLHQPFSAAFLKPTLYSKPTKQAMGMCTYKTCVSCVSVT